MNNRLTLGLAVGAGYLLGRTKKAKLAFAVGTMVMGKRMQLGPRALADAVTAHLRDNPQVKEIGDQLREDLRGVGKAATGALVNRQISGLADRLHERTLGVQDRVSGATEALEDEVGAKVPDAKPAKRGAKKQTSETTGDGEARKPAARKSTAQKSAGQKPAAKKSVAGRTSPKATSGKRPAPRKRTATRKAAAERGGRSDG